MNILIIKTGLTETFDTSHVHHSVVSLGDVLRTTVVLHLFKEHEISWLTSQEAFYLLDGLHELKNVFLNLNGINFSDYDLIINLERTTDILEVLKSVQSDKILGFISINNQVLLKGNDFSTKLHNWLSSSEIVHKNWCQKLFILLGNKWNGENYLLPQKNLILNQTDQYDVGLNWQVGSKWPSKSWQKENWELLEKKIESSLSVTWQKGFDNLIEYMNWINSAKVIVTHDSLGLHIARALNKKILALFGPTSSREIYLGEGVAFSEAEKPSFSCPPCYKDSCHNMIHCMKSLSVDEVENGLRALNKGIDGKLATGRK
jgi:heptosyltransferase-2